MTFQKDLPLPPGFLARIDPAQFSVGDLMSLAVLENGQAMSLDAIAARLAQIGVSVPLTSLRKHGALQGVLRKTRDGRIALARGAGKNWLSDFVIPRAHDLLFGVPKTVVPAKRRKTVAEIRAEADGRSPVTHDEFRRAAAYGWSSTISTRRRIAFLTEASGGELKVADALRILKGCGEDLSMEKLQQVVPLTSGIVTLRARELLVAHPEHPSFEEARRCLRQLLTVCDAAQEEKRQSEEWQRKHDEEKARQSEERRRAYALAAKAVIHCAFLPGGAWAAVLLEPESMLLQHFSDPREFIVRVKEYDLILGLDPLGMCERVAPDMDVDDRVVIDLRVWEKRAYFHGVRGSAVAPEQVIQATLGAFLRFSLASELARAARGESHDALCDLLRRNVWLLWRLYEYGCLHGYVCFDTDDWRVRCRVDWNVGCLPDLQHIAREAIETGAEMDVVLCAASGWERPWRDALRVCVTEMDDELLTVVPVDDGPAAAFSLDEIQAIRAVPADEQKAVQWPCDYHNVC